MTAATIAPAANALAVSTRHALQIYALNQQHTTATLAWQRCSEKLWFHFSNIAWSTDGTQIMEIGGIAPSHMFALNQALQQKLIEPRKKKKNKKKNRSRSKADEKQNT